MGRFQLEESLSEEKDDEDEQEEQEEKEIVKKRRSRVKVEDIEKRERTVSNEGGGEPAKEEEIQFGEQLQDDLINSFCDKLQAVSPKRLEALLAIQYLLITDMPEVRKHVTGKNSAYQVLYDRTRSHYLLIRYDPTREVNGFLGCVEIYDSLQTYDERGDLLVLPEISNQIVHIFGHLFRDLIPILADREYETQADHFSCGYRVIGALVDLARGEDPATFSYSRNCLLAFMKYILNEPRPTWEMFKTAKLGRKKSYSGQYLRARYIRNTSFVPSTTSSSQTRMSSSTDSLASNLSQISQSSRIYPSSETSKSSKSSQKSIERAKAGFWAPREEPEFSDEEEDEEERMHNYFQRNNMRYRYVSRNQPPAPVNTLSTSYAPEPSFMDYFKSCNNFLGGLFRRSKHEKGGSFEEKYYY